MDEDEVGTLEGEGTGEGGEADPWAALRENYTEETVADFERVVQQQVEVAAQQAAAEAEQRFRAGNGRWGNATNRLRDQFGLVVDERGELAVADPDKFVGVARRFRGENGDAPPPAAAPAPAAEEEITIDPLDPPEVQTAKIRQLAARETQKAVEAATKPLQDMIQQLTGVVSQQALTPAMQAAKTSLARTGMADIADTPEFQQNFQGLVNNLDFAARQNPANIRAVALMAAAATDEQFEAAGRDWRKADPPQQPPAAPPAPRVPAPGSIARGGMERAAAPRSTAPAEEQVPTDLLFGNGQRVPVTGLRVNVHQGNPAGEPVQGEALRLAIAAQDNEAMRAYFKAERQRELAANGRR